MAKGNLSRSFKKGAGLILACCLVTAFTPAASDASSDSSPTKSHVSVGVPFQEGTYMGPIDPNGIKQFASATSTNVTIATEYLPANGGWAAMDGANGTLAWLTNAWKNSGYTLSLGIPMIPTNAIGQPQANLASGATGAYNSYFTSLASALVAAGEGNAYLRLGWEFDGNWYAWQAQSLSAESEYAAYFRQIVNSMRSVPGAAFEFVWNPDASAFVTSGYSVAAAYPGNAYVNVIGLDLYDMSWVTPLTPQNAWSSTYLPELTAAESFAQSQNKPLALCEWGALIRPSEHGLGDDPYYVSNMINWMKVASHDVTYESYFNGNTLATNATSTQDLIGGNFPNSLAAFTASLQSSLPSWRLPNLETSRQLGSI